MKPNYTINIKKNKRLYNYLNKIYRKGQHYSFILAKMDKNTNQEEVKKLRTEKEELLEKFRDPDMNKIYQAAEYYLNEGLTRHDLGLFVQTLKNVGLNETFKIINDVIDNDEELTAKAKENQIKLDNIINNVATKNGYRDKLNAFLDKDTVKTIIGNLESNINKFRNEYIVEQQKHKYDIDTVLLAKQQYLKNERDRLIAIDKIKGLDGEKRDILDNILDEALDSYYVSVLEFNDAEKQEYASKKENYKVSSMNQSLFMHKNDYGINRFIFEYMMTSQYDKVSFNESLYNFYNDVLGNENITSKAKFDVFMNAFAKDIFTDIAYQSSKTENIIKTFTTLINIYNEMAKSKGASLVDVKEFSDGALKEYYYNLYGTKYIDDQMKEFEQHQINNQKLTNGQVDTLHQEFSNAINIFNQHMVEMKALTDEKPLKTYSIDMEVYRKNYNYLKQIHEQRGFFSKLVNRRIHKQEQQALANYVKTFTEAFNIKGDDNVKEATKMITSKTPLLYKDNTHQKFVSADSNVSSFTSGKVRDEFILGVKTEPKPKEELKEQNIINEEKEENIINENEKKVPIVVEMDNNKQNNVLKQDELVDYVLGEEKYRITKEKLDEINHFINNPDPMGEREEGEVGDDVIKQNFLKDIKPVAQKQEIGAKK